MSLLRTTRILIVSVAIACLVGAGATTSLAAPLSAQTAEDRAAVERAVAQYEAAKDQADRLDERVAASSAELDAVLAKRAEAQARLSARVSSMYRADEMDSLTILFGATTITEFFARVELLARVAAEDAATLRDLEVAEAAAQRTASELIELQTQSAQALDAAAEELASARAQLASSEAALAEYEARAAAAEAASRAKAAARTSSPAPTDTTQQLTGSGDWLTGVASHYSATFTGRSASGEEIGPYSMIVAHKTLPFGTLIEFEYNGKRAVARVVDRGPYTAGRDFDLGPGVVRALGFSGVHEVRYRIISQ